MKPEVIGFIGLGLIGGSIAKAIHRVSPEIRLIACDRDTESLTAALSEGVISEASDDISESFSNCDIIFMCAPVSVNVKNLSILKKIIKPDCILTDVGSVKTSMHEAVHAEGLSGQFVGGHPMAGSEKSGYASASDRLLENAYYVLTPSKSSPAFMKDIMVELVNSIVSIPIVLSCHEHDHIVSAISHLPHIIAYTLVNLVRESDNPDGLMRMLAAGGFKDITRIASSSPIMWQSICSENQGPLMEMLEDYISRLNRIGQLIQADDKDALLEQFGLAKDYRDDIPVSKAQSIIKSIHEIYVDIIDESGAIATIATILATNGISIKNIGIIHNREFQEGVLRIEFYEQDATDRASALLQKFHYIIHKRN